MSNTSASWTVPREIAGRLIIFHDPVEDGIDDENVVCATADDLVDAFDDALARGLTLGADFTVLANTEVPGLVDRLGAKYYARFPVDAPGDGEQIQERE